MREINPCGHHLFCEFVKKQKKMMNKKYRKTKKDWGGEGETEDSKCDNLQVMKRRHVHNKADRNWEDKFSLCRSEKVFHIKISNYYSPVLNCYKLHWRYHFVKHYFSRIAFVNVC